MLRRPLGEVKMLRRPLSEVNKAIGVRSDTAGAQSAKQNEKLSQKNTWDEFLKNAVR